MVHIINRLIGHVYNLPNAIYETPSKAVPRAFGGTKPLVFEIAITTLLLCIRPKAQMISQSRAATNANPRSVGKQSFLSNLWGVKFL